MSYKVYGRIEKDFHLLKENIVYLVDVKEFILYTARVVWYKSFIVENDEGIRMEIPLDIFTDMAMFFNEWRVPLQLPLFKRGVYERQIARLSGDSS